VIDEIGTHTREVTDSKANFVKKRAAVARISLNQFHMLKRVDDKTGIYSTATTVIAGRQSEDLRIEIRRFPEIDCFEPNKGDAIDFGSCGLGRTRRGKKQQNGGNSYNTGNRRLSEDSCTAAVRRQRDSDIPKVRELPFTPYSIDFFSEYQRLDSVASNGSGFRLGS
jgi:hypothetical protein